MQRCLYIVTISEQALTSYTAPRTTQAFAELETMPLISKYMKGTFTIMEHKLCITGM